jgi:hypothetical protein
MEVMSAAGLPTVLFCVRPMRRCWRASRGALHRHRRVLARTFPQWMEEHLPRLYRAGGAGAPLMQYKVCSTFDSSPETGSIGRAIDIGTRHLRGDWSPMVGAPRLKRYQVFGNLFAAWTGGATGSIAIRPCRAIRSRPWTSPTCAGICGGRPRAASNWWTCCSCATGRAGAGAP